MKNRFEIRGDVTAIFLRRKDGAALETLIDTADLSVAQAVPGTWYAFKDKNTGRYYVMTRITIAPKNRRHILLHRAILMPDERMEIEVDHFSHDTLDNCRMNLRAVSKSGNLQNRFNTSRLTESGSLNVSWYARTKKWRARITVEKKVHYLGHFSQKEEAENSVMLARAKYMPCSKEAMSSQTARG